MNSFSIHSCCGHTYARSHTCRTSRQTSLQDLSDLHITEWQEGGKHQTSRLPHVVAGKGCRRKGEGGVWTWCFSWGCSEGSVAFQHTWKRPFVFLNRAGQLTSRTASISKLPVKAQMCGISLGRVLCFWLQGQSHWRTLKFFSFGAEGLETLNVDRKTRSIWKENVVILTQHGENELTRPLTLNLDSKYNVSTIISWPEFRIQLYRLPVITWCCSAYKYQQNALSPIKRHLFLNSEC